MNVHSGARSCRASRALLVERILTDGWPVEEAAEAAGLSRRSAFKWLRRYREEGPQGWRTAVPAHGTCRVRLRPNGGS